ncbi:LytR/AlgR family response regulator transcription factor [Fulvivirgaceae bacterium LMO-SS25]
MKTKCIIIEDEPLALEGLKNHVKKLKSLQLEKEFDNAIDAIEFLNSNTIDLIFLDIEMDELSGIDLLESITYSGHIIITTAYPSYALKGYELNVTDYLLKPYSFERFIKAVNKAIDKKAIQDDSNFIFIKTENKLVKIDIDSILFIEGMGDYRRIHSTEKKIMTLENFNELEKRIPSIKICRVHKSFMVSISKIEAIERNRIKIKDTIIPISKTYQESFFQLINNSDV